MRLGRAGLDDTRGTGGGGENKGEGEGTGKGGERAEGTKVERIWKRLCTVEVRGEF